MKFLTELVLVISVIPESVFATRNSSIAIIGAGFAGLSAAIRLEQFGFRDITIFEASDRVGGRVFPVQFESGFLQHGAQYINGRKNLIYEIANQLNLVVGNDAAGDFFDSAKFATGTYSPSRADITLFREFIDPLEAKYERLAEQNPATTVGKLFQADYNSFLQKNRLLDRRNFFDALSRLYRAYVEGEYAADWNDLALAAYDEFDDGDGNDKEFQLNRIGFAAILQYFKNKLNNTLILLNQRITVIDYSRDTRDIKLHTSGGDRHYRSFDYVVVTVPLGHLKRFGSAMFRPPLPKLKMEAIEKLGFGHLSKVFLVYSTPLLPDNVTTLHPLIVDGSATPLQNCLNTFEPLFWQRRVLVVWLSGVNCSKMVDEMEDENIQNQFTQFLRDRLGNQTLPEPESIISSAATIENDLFTQKLSVTCTKSTHVNTYQSTEYTDQKIMDFDKRFSLSRTRWSRNDLFGGSYSYISAAAASMSDSAYQIMARPVKVGDRKRLLFAGEATHPSMFQTTIGAFLSGKREAERIANDAI